MKREVSYQIERVEMRELSERFFHFGLTLIPDQEVAGAFLQEHKD